MDVLTFTMLLFVTSVFAGLLGALTGLGRGVVIVPAFSTRPILRSEIRIRARRQPQSTVLPRN